MRVWEIPATNAALIGPFQDPAIFHAIIFDAQQMRAGTAHPNWGVFTPTGIESFRPAQNTSGMQANLQVYQEFTALFGPSTTPGRWYMAFVPRVPPGSYGAELGAQVQEVDTTFSKYLSLAMATLL